MSGSYDHASPVQQMRSARPNVTAPLIYEGQAEGPRIVGSSSQGSLFGQGAQQELRNTASAAAQALPSAAVGWFHSFDRSAGAYDSVHPLSITFIDLGSFDRVGTRGLFG